MILTAIIIMISTVTITIMTILTSTIMITIQRLIHPKLTPTQT